MDFYEVEKVFSISESQMMKLWVTLMQSTCHDDDACQYFHQMLYTFYYDDDESKRPKIKRREFDAMQWMLTSTGILA